MSDPKIKSFMMQPPGGEFFFAHDGEEIRDRNWFLFKPKMLELMKRHGLRGTAESLVSAYMCPSMPDWYCTAGGIKTVRLNEAQSNAEPYFSKYLVDADVIKTRLAVCRKCPKHSRTFCMTCTGLLQWINAKFGGRRKKIPGDELSGICTCCDTFESVVCSVDGPANLDDVPDNCWAKMRGGDQ